MMRLFLVAISSLLFLLQAGAATALNPCEVPEVEIHTWPRFPGDPVQSFPSRMYRMQGELFGNPDFCTLRMGPADPKDSQAYGLCRLES